MVEYKRNASSGVAKAGLATAAATAGVMLLGANGNGNGMLGNLFGGQQKAVDTAVETSVLLPLVTSALVANQGAHNCHEGGGYVTKETLGLVRENSEKDATIAKLTSEAESKKYTDEVVKPLEKRVCNLEAAHDMEVERRRYGDRELRTYVDGEFIKARKRISSDDIDYDACEPVIRAKRCCCCHDGRDHGHGEN